MNNLKKMVAFLLVCLCLIMSVTPAMEASAASGYSFKSKGATATPGSSASSFIKANKKYFKKMKNSASCVASSGYDVTREYKYFTLVTYADKKNGKGKVESITIKNKDVTTPEGAHCGMSVDELKEIYKNAKKLAKTYYVTKGKTKISFLIKDDKVSEINYLYTGKY